MGVLADIGQPVYHVGDEAIAHATVAALRARDVTPVLLTRDRRHTAEYFGDVPTVETLPFAHGPLRRSEELAQLRASVSAAGRGDARSAALRRELRSMDAMHIAGGGNLNSQYGWLLTERVAVGMLACAEGRPLSVSGQTLGPALNGFDRADLGELLHAARLVGLRDRASVALAAELDVSAHHVPDDASFFVPDTSTTPEGSIVVTFSRDLLDALGADGAEICARLLDAIARQAQGAVIFVPHMATPGLGDGDEAVHSEIAARMTHPLVHVLGIERASEAAARVRGARLVVTSRFHPVVFALAAGVPVLPLAASGYSFVRMSGVLENWGMPDRVLPAHAVRDPLLADVIEEALAADDVRAHLGRTHAPLRRAHEHWWDAVAEGAVSGSSEFVAGMSLPGPAASRDLVERYRWSMEQSLLITQLAVDVERDRQRAEWAERELGAVIGSRGWRAVERARRVLRR